ncbi:MAG TPA: SRPBCC family protein [Streptosporangiaceae bacterium]|nr:SRPBCC family protein [Streptosporangiaceae bacterium]
MTERTANHATFVIERSYPSTPARVFAAWASDDAKAIWMDDPDFKSDGSESDMDFRVGGHERFGGLGPEGTPYRYDATYYDIITNERIVYCYEMYSGDERMSVSVTTIEFAPDDEGTRLTYTEQGVFLDDIDKPEAREEGTRWLLDNLGKYLAKQSSQ